MYHFVYITTNLITGKQYIGDHSSLVIDDNYLGSGDYLKLSIKKHGRKNFKREILEFFPEKIKAFEAQSRYIQKYNTLYPNGYNISPLGGHNVRGCMSRETIEKISRKNKKHPNIIFAMKNRIVSDETRQKMSKSKKGKTPWNKNGHHTEEAKQKMSKSKKGMYIGEKNPMSGKSPFEIWAAKYGAEEAEKRKKKFYENRKKTLIKCEFCQKEIPLNIYNRCHGKKCKDNGF
jgi:hypothetical protein